MRAFSEQVKSSKDYITLHVKCSCGCEIFNVYISRRDSDNREEAALLEKKGRSFGKAKRKRLLVIIGTLKMANFINTAQVFSLESKQPGIALKTYQLLRQKL